MKMLSTSSGLDWWAEVTHRAKDGGSFSEMMGPSISNLPNYHSWHLGRILYLHTDTLTADYIVNPS